MSGKPNSIGNNGDSAFHLANQMLLQQPELFPKDVEIREVIGPSRLPSDLVIYRCAVATADLLFHGDLFPANLVLFWVLHLAFIAGYYFLGLAVLRTPGRAAIFAALYILPAPAIFTWTGMGYGTVIPHALGLAMLPWCSWGYLQWNQQQAHRARGMYLLFFLMGLAVNVYPQHPIHAFLIIVLTILMCRDATLVQLGLAGLAFGLGAAPTLASSLSRTMGRFSDLSFSDQQIVRALFERYYSFLLNPGVFLRGVLRLRLWFYIVLGGVIYGYKWFTVKLTEPEKHVIALTLSSVIVSVGGGVASMVYRPIVTLLFSRASALLYLGSYLACVWLAAYLWQRHKVRYRILAVGLVSLFAVNGLEHTPILAYARGNLGAPSSPDYYALSDWAAENTAADSLFMVPMRPSDSYYAFRVYAMRGVTMQWGSGDMVMSNPGGAVTYYWPRSVDILPLYVDGGDTTDFVRVAHKYSADYIITDTATPHQPALPILYQNETYIVFAVP
jgi:hypothetical protein